MRQLLATTRPAQAMILFAIWLPVMLGMLGLLYSVGFVLIERRALQTAADAASLAATWSLLYELESGSLDSAKVYAALPQYATQEAGVGFSAAYTDASGKATLGTVATSGQFPSTARGVRVTVQKTVPIVLDKVIGMSGIPTAATSTAGLVPTDQPIPAAPTLPVAVNLTTDFIPAMANQANYDLLAPTMLPLGAVSPFLDFAPGHSPAAAFAPGGQPPDYGYSQPTSGCSVEVNPQPCSSDRTGPSSIFTNLQFWSDGRHPPALLAVPSAANIALAPQPPPPLANSAFTDPTNLNATAEQLAAYQDAFIAGLRDNIQQQGRVDASGGKFGLVVVPLWDSATAGAVHVAAVALMRIRLADVTYTPSLTDPHVGKYSASGQFILYPAAAWGTRPATSPATDVGARLVRLIA